MLLCQAFQSLLLVLVLQKTEGRLESIGGPLQGHISTPAIQRDKEFFSLAGLPKEPLLVTS